MEIDSYNTSNNRAIVEFANLRERQLFGYSAPLTSMEWHRATSYTTRGVLYFGLIRPYSRYGAFFQPSWIDENEGFPQTTITTHRTLGHVAGKLMERSARMPTSSEDLVIIEGIVSSIHDYFVLQRRPEIIESADQHIA